MIRVLIVDDSDTSRKLMRYIINSAPDMTVIGELTDGDEAVAQVKKLKPDVILMDVVMSRMDGMTATGEIMARFPTPIVMISATAYGRETEMAFQAIKRGALSLLAKPVGPDHAEFDEQAGRLISTLRAMADVRVIHHLPRNRPEKPERQTPLSKTLNAPPAIVGVVASTGGPAALADMFRVLPADFPLPIVVVQHIAQDFQRSLLAWIDNVSALPVRLAKEGAAPQPGITFAPSNIHLLLDENQQFAFSDVHVGAHMPSGDVLLTSIARAYGAASVGVVLTGMGADGASGLLDMFNQGALTIAQNEKTSAVYGMPGEAKRIGAVRYELALNLIAPMLKDIVEREIS